MPGILSTAVSMLGLTSPLEATSKAERLAALEKRKSEHEATLRARQLEIDRLRSEAHEAQRQAIAADEALEAQTHARLSAEIHAEVHGGLVAALRSWVDPERETPDRVRAVQIRRLLVRCNARSQDELGAPLDPGVLTDAFGELFVEKNPATASVFGSRDNKLVGFGDAPHELAIGVLKAAENTTTPLALTRALEALELSIAKRIAGCAVEHPGCRDRMLARRGHVTTGDRALAVAAFNDAEAAAEKAKAIAEAERTPPPKRLGPPPPSFSGGF